MRWFYILMLVAIIISLFSALMALMKSNGQSTKTVKALTIRVALSITLFLILVLFKSGLVHF